MKYLLAILLLITPASAWLQIGQGDHVYMNETVDISQAVSWPAFQICWCSQRNYDCDPPDQVIDIEGNMLDYYIDPAKFKYGTYYRWDGSWHRGENSVAFSVIPGKRPVESEADNKTITATNDTPIKQITEGPFNYVIARGDSPLLYTTIIPKTEYIPDAHLWIFSNTLMTLDMPMVRTGNVYSYQMTKELTSNMAVGNYVGYIQTTGFNRVQDIFLDGTVLDTPYDDTLIPDVNILQWNIRSVKEDFDVLRSKVALFDDDLIPVTVSVSPMEIVVTSVEQTKDKLYIAGETTLDNTSVFTVQLDPDNYKLRSDIMLHTWQAHASGGIEAKREFATALDIDAKELYVGSHEVIISVEKGGYTAETAYDFKVTDTFIMPTPTPETKRLIVGGDYEGINYRAMPTKEIITTPEPTTAVPEVVITPEPTQQITTLQTVALTTIPTTVPVANETIPTVPIETNLIIAGIGIAFFIWRMR